MIHFGEMKCGKVDQFGKLFYVVSDFFHVNFVPLIPLRSHLMLTEPPAGTEEEQLQIRMSVKSVLMAWIRTALVLLVLVNGIAVLRNLTRLVFFVKPGQAPRPEAVWDAVLNPLWLVVGFLIFFGLTYRFSRASWTRALHLAALVGLTEEDLDAHLLRLRSPRREAEREEEDQTD